MKHILLLLLLFTITSFGQQKNGSIGFIENKGQIMDQNGKPNPTVQFLLNTNGLNVQIKKTGFSYDIYETKKIPLKQRIIDKSTLSSLESNKKVPDYTLEYVFHRIDIDFVNANPNVQFVSEEKSTDYDNYYNIPNKPEGVLLVHKFKQITYKNIYPNIDIVFSIPKDTLKAVEYNFVIHPNGKISDIQLKFNGAKTELLDNKIKMNVRFGQMEEILPASWTEDGMKKNSITVNYKKIKNNVYGFNTRNAVNGKTVIIDPVPTRLWGTFYGDERNIHYTIGNPSITVDSYGNSYMTGTTTASNSSYATTGSHQTSIPSYTYLSSNGIIVKFAPNGNRLWGTYYGGQGLNTINDIKIDSQNNLLITGNSPSISNISTPGSYKPNLSGGSDAFLVKFNDSGIRLWGTYFGGENDDIAYAMDIDQTNNIYIVGRTLSNTGIAVNSNFQTQLNDGFYKIDGFLAKFKFDGNLFWSTYVGGEGTDELKAITVKNNYLITAGSTNSFNNVATPGVFQENHDLNTHTDGVVYKFSLDGHRIWATYYGGEQVDYVYSVEADDEDNVYLGGESASTTNISTSNKFDGSNQYLYKGFFSKLNSNGQRISGFYLGATKVYSLLFKNNSIYVGATNSGFSDPKITTPCSYRPTGVFTGYIGKFSKQADLIWGTYVGNNSSSSSTRIVLDNNNSIFVCGLSSQNNGIADNTSYQPTVLGTFNNYFLMKFLEDNTNVTATNNSPICIGNNLELKASGGTNYLWIGPNGFSSTEQNPIILNATALNSGQYSCTITGTGGCDGTKKTDVVVGDFIAPVPDLTALSTIIGDCNTTITTVPTATDACAGTIIATTTSSLTYNLPGTYTIVWNYNDGNGNSFNQNQTVTITSQPRPSITTPQTFCFKQNAAINNIAITGQNIKWYDALTNGNLLPNTTTVQNGTTYYASQTINGCESDRTAVLVTIQNTLLPTANTNQSFCTGTNPSIANIQITGNQIKWYDAQNNGALLAETTTLVNGVTYYASQTINNCESERLGVHVSIVNTPTAPTANATQSFCKNENATLGDIQITGQNTKWYDTNFSAASLANTTLLEDNKTYYASQTIGCESDRTPVLIRVYNTPLPIANKNQQFCIDENATIANISISGSNITWYDEPANGNILSETTLLQDGKTYYATQTLNNCESNRLAITVKIQDTQSPIANSPQTFCIQKNAKISDIVISGQNINWYESASSSIPLSDFTLLENGITYYATQTINNCESERIPVAIIIQEATTEDCINFVDELPYPKFFTPNNDGYNDTWTIDFAYLKPNTGIQIFDRYGKLLKVLLPDAAWNGQFNNLVLPATDYWFIVTRANGQEYKGHFSLKR
ncbi:hypothetical protein GCM10008015_15650 [Flavobacterium palustre]|uniref:Ig-like domain-containing protein n=1 Tax=Flavobacterium palustre TaxID=1476463 RepID=A0ABQ1HH61_9FLAO|nr:T9SS type B sorting domain-containing protein [Flavobacterium palustre]GGA75904.1 hypothetical protein GCM10008015_15650 [Flavobacterium palustre]